MAVVPASYEWIVVAYSVLAVSGFRVAGVTADTPEPSSIALPGLGLRRYIVA